MVGRIHMRTELVKNCPCQKLAILDRTLLSILASHPLMPRIRSIPFCCDILPSTSHTGHLHIGQLALHLRGYLWDILSLHPLTIPTSCEADDY